MSPATILLVDDEAPIRSSLRRLFFLEDYHILTADGAEEALALIKKNTVHVIVSDQEMPGMQGVELLRAVRDSSPHTSRILFSGHVDIELLRQAVNGGEVYRFITKPWNDSELRLAVRHAAERSQLLMHNQSLQQERSEALELRNQALLLNQDLLDHLPVLVIGIDPNGLVVVANELARRVFPELVPGLAIDESLPEELFHWLEKVKKHKETAAQAFHFEYKQQLLQLEAVSLDERGLIISASLQSCSASLR